MNLALTSYSMTSHCASAAQPGVRLLAALKAHARGIILSESKSTAMTQMHLSPAVSTIA